MRLYLVNPKNPLVSLANVRDSRWNRYRVWKPMGLLVLAGLTPPEWGITLVDENLDTPDYLTMPRPDLVGITAFTSQTTLCRHRPIAHVIDELASIQEKWVGVVDDNLIGTNDAHIARAKELFRAVIQADLRKKWICQATINMADDDELFALAAQAGCCGVCIGFESPTAEGLAEVGKKFNIVKGRDFPAPIRRIHKRNILVVGSFIMGLDADAAGISLRIAKAPRPALWPVRSVTILYRQGNHDDNTQG